MRSVVVFTMLLMEMFLLYSFSKFDFSCTWRQVKRNELFLYFWPVLVLVSFFYVYVPLANVDQFDLAPMDVVSILIAVVFSVAFYMVVEGLKCVHRHFVLKDLAAKRVISSIVACGEASAFIRTKQAKRQFPERFGKLV